MTKGLRLLSWLALTLNLHAGVSFWDGNGAVAGAGATPAGTWGVNTYWSADTNGTVSTTAWTSGNTAVFSAGTDATGTYTVFISGNQTVGGLAFEEGSPTLWGGSILPNATPFLISVSNQATISSALIGTRSLTKVGNGTLILNGTNNYTGATTIAQGSVVVANNTAFGSTSAGTTISNGASLQLHGDIALKEPLLIFSSFSSIGSVHNVSGSNWVAAVQMDPDRNHTGSFTSESGVLTLGRVTAGNNFQLTIYCAGDTIISGDDPAYGLFWGGETSVITKQNNGVLLINGLVNIRGFLGVLGGTVRMGNHRRFGNSGGVYPSLSVQSLGQFDLNGFTNYIESVQGTGLVTSSVPGGTLIIGADTDSTALGTYFHGNISGPTTLIKEGQIVQRLRGAKTYTGETIVNSGLLDCQPCTINNSPVIRVATDGALLVNESLPGLVINSNQTVACSGSVTGSLTVVSGARICPGHTDAVGRMFVSTASGSGGVLDFSPGGTYVWQLGANSETNAGTDFDQILMRSSAPVILGGSSRLRIEFIGSATPPDFNHPFWQKPRTWNIIASINTGSNFAVIENGTFPAGNFTTSVATNGIWLTFTPVCPIVIACPSNIVVECAGGVTPVTYSATAVDCASNLVPVVFTPPSGSGFRRGTSNVICTATSPGGITTNCTFTITVVDTAPPSVTCSPNITVQATSPSGAVVTYTSGAVDACGLRSFNCTPPSGSTFPVGTNTVTCTGVDGGDNTNVCSFTITVTPPNQCPIATIAVSPSLSADCTGLSNVVIAVNNTDACVTLNGTASSDPDDDPLSYLWNLGGQVAIGMDSAQESGGGGTGSGTGTVLLSGNTLTLNIGFSDLSANATAAHIHGPAAPGINAPVLYPLNAITTLGTTAGTINGAVTLVNGTGGFTIAQQLQQLSAGLWYINIHSPLNPVGEIRGQIPGGQLQTGAVATNCLPIGSHQVCLMVSDGPCTNTACVTVEVISPCESVGTLIAAIEASSLPRNRQRPLIATLKAACESFADGRLKPGINQLGTFQNKVRAQVSDAALAQHLIDCTQAIIDALSGP